MLEILYQDDYLVAVNKPHGLLVHQSSLARDAREFALQKLRDQLGKIVYPVHRLDRKTSGVLLFAFTPELNSLLQQQFMRGEVDKTYLALLRGFAPESGCIDYPLVNASGKSQEAITAFNVLEKFELQVPFGKYDTSRYSLVEARPTTGRMHQLRKHFAHIYHPIIGDRPYGCNKQNKLFLENWQLNDMLLHASTLAFAHPITGNRLEIVAQFQSEFERILTVFNRSNLLQNSSNK